MGSYAAIADVQALIPEFTIDATSEPSTTQVDNFILAIEAEINGILASEGYESIPATGSNDVALLKGQVSRRVAALTWVAAFLDDDPPWKVKDWTTAYREFLNRLRQGQQPLVDQLPQGDDAPYFAIARHPTRDDLFTERGDQTDWDE